MYRISGRILYLIVKPLIKWYIKDSRRSYALITKGSQVLLVRNWLGNGAWSLPGGGAHSNETFAEAVAREVYEEVGVKFDPPFFRLITKGTWVSNGFSYAYQCSSVQLTSDVALSKQLLEITDARFIDMDEAKGLANIAPEIANAIAALQAAMALEQILR